MCVYTRSPVGAAAVQPAVCVPSCASKSNSVRPTDCQTWFDWFWLGKAGQMPIFGVRGKQLFARRRSRGCRAAAWLSLRRPSA